MGIATIVIHKVICEESLSMSQIYGLKDVHQKRKMYIETLYHSHLYRYTFTFNSSYHKDTSFVVIYYRTIIFFISYLRNIYI